MQGTNPKLTALLLTILGALARLLPHPANFAPIGAGALFGGAKLGRPWNYLVPLLTLAVSDAFLGFHRTMPFVYAAFVVVVAVGEMLPKRNSWLSIGVSSLAASVIFFTLSNFGVWLVGNLYPLTAAGLATCFTMALPFFAGTLFGDLLYTYGFFGIYALVENRQQQTVARAVRLNNK